MSLSTWERGNLGRKNEVIQSKQPPSPKAEHNMTQGDEEDVRVFPCSLQTTAALPWASPTPIKQSSLLDVVSFHLN